MDEKELQTIFKNKIEINPNWFYHGFPFHEEKFKNMLLEGIKCPQLLHTFSGGINGKYYISVAKRIDVNHSAFKLYQNHYPLWIMQKVNVKKPSCFMQTTAFEDEWHAFWKIKPKKIIGIEYALSYFLKHNPTTAVETLTKMILLLQSLNISLPIYDFSMEKEIDQVNFLQYSIQKKF